jgi:hypothetical protein
MMNPENFIYIYLASAFGGAFFFYFMMKLMGYAAPDARRAKQLEEWDRERYAKQCRRLGNIQKICNRHMDSLPQNLQTLDRQILVSYEDLLKIWDACNYVKDDL